MSLFYAKRVVDGVTVQKQYTSLPVEAPELVPITQTEYTAIPVNSGFDLGSGGGDDGGGGGPGGGGGGEALE
jgi:hypothetical protein